MASLAQMKREAEAQSMKALGAYRGSRAAEKSGMQKLQDRREQTRQDFFKGREDISPDRLDRRQIQKDLYEKFKKEQMSIVPGTTNLYQSKTPGGPTLSDEANRLARMYGPTMKEIGSDIGYGIKSIGSALGEKIASGNFGILGIAKALYEKFTNSTNAAKDYLNQQVSKLSDINLERLKNKDKYQRTSQVPELQNIYQLEKNVMTEKEKADLIRKNMEQTTSLIEKSTPSYTKQPGSGYQAGSGMGIPAIAPSFINAPGTGYTPSPLNYNSMPGFTIQTDYESPEQRMQRLIEESQNQNNQMFDSGIVKNKLSELEKVFNISSQ